MSIDEEHKEELMREEQREVREEPLYVWIEEHLSDLEGEFINTFPPEDQPLDDDIPDFLHNYGDEFDSFAREKYQEDVGQFE